MTDILNQKAPNFTLRDQNGQIHELKDYKGKWLVLYFYPKDDTPGCTKEACSFRDHTDSLKKNNVVVMGISADPITSHQKFADKYHLNFPLLSDTNKKVITSYGAWGSKQLMGKKYKGILRNTYLINPDGLVKKIYQNVIPQDHAKEILSNIIVLKLD